MAAVALPSNVSFGTVIGRFLVATADSPADPDRDPEGIGATDLAITFSAGITPKIARDISASPPVTFALADVSATVGADGTLLGPDGAPGVRLVASTNPNLDPSPWAWAVKIGSATFPTLTFSFTLDPGATVDLATVLQVPATPSQTLAQWLQAVSDAQAARDAAIAAATTATNAATAAQTAAATAAANVQAALSTVVGNAPSALDTLAEIDAQIQADEGSAAALAATVAGKEPAGLSSATRASLAATYATKAQLGAITTVDNSNGTATITATGSSTATDNGNGTATIAA